MPTIRIPSNRTLGNICVYGAVASISAVMYMRWKLEDRVRNTNYYKLAMQTLRQHKGAISLLGEPIKESGFDLSDVNNTCNAEKAQFEVSVRGSKDKGTLYFWASNHKDRGWLIDRLELETNRNPDKRFLLRKSSDEFVYALHDNLGQQNEHLFHSMTHQAKPSSADFDGESFAKNSEASIQLTTNKEGHNS